MYYILKEGRSIKHFGGFPGMAADFLSTTGPNRDLIGKKRVLVVGLTNIPGLLERHLEH
nr:hypothetical protein [uncultured Methanoregula sp.]